MAANISLYDPGLTFWRERETDEKPAANWIMPKHRYGHWLVAFRKRCWPLVQQPIHSLATDDNSTILNESEWLIIDVHKVIVCREVGYLPLWSPTLWGKASTIVSQTQKTLASCPFVKKSSIEDFSRNVFCDRPSVRLSPNLSQKSQGLVFG